MYSLQRFACLTKILRSVPFFPQFQVSPTIGSTQTGLLKFWIKMGRQEFASSCLTGKFTQFDVNMSFCQTEMVHHVRQLVGITMVMFLSAQKNRGVAHKSSPLAFSLF